MVVVGALFKILCADVTIAKNGAPLAFICADSAVMLSFDKTHARLRASVEDLAYYLVKMSGASIPIVNHLPDNNDAGVPLLVGDPASRKFGGPAVHSAYAQAWRLAISRKGIGFIGESDEAVSYAIYEFLDRLGCRWYMPGDLGEVCPRWVSISIRESDVSDTPRTIARNIWYGDEAFKRRNRLGGINLAASQTLESLLPAKVMQAHIDWNAEINGVRSVNGRLCWANDSMAAALSDTIIARIGRTGAPSISLSPHDGISFCQCSKCKALDAGDWDPSMGCVSITDRYINFCNRVISRVAAVYPRELFGFVAYVQYTRPPVREKPDPRLVPKIAPITYCREHSMADSGCPSQRQLRGIVQGWAANTSMLATDEYGYGGIHFTQQPPT